MMPLSTAGLLRQMFIVGVTWLITSNIVSALAVEGLYTLSSITYADSTTVPIPEEYFSTLTFIGDEAYSFDLHVMNRMFTTMTVKTSEEQIVQEKDNDTSITSITTTTPVSVSQIGSTRMMPPSDINDVEIGLRTILPETTDIIHQQLMQQETTLLNIRSRVPDNSTTLTFDGTAGSVVFKLEGGLPVE
jgi:hypothetical protein